MSPELLSPQHLEVATKAEEYIKACIAGHAVRDCHEVLVKDQNQEPAF